MHPSHTDTDLRKFMTSKRRKETEIFDAHDLSPQKADRLDTDMAGGYATSIRRALVGRYRLCRKLHKNTRYWNTYNEQFREFSADLPHEPSIIAAALAIRPSDYCDWEIVERWSWVYRYALLIDVSVDEFERFCERTSPEQSHKVVLRNLKRSANIPVLPRADTPTSLDGANRHA